MLRPFFTLAMLAPARQLTFRRVAVGHALFLALAAWMTAADATPHGVTTFGYAMLALAMVEGAALVGWRLTQLPKSQALEFLLVSPLQPKRIFTAEALVGFSRFALVWLGGLPVYLALILTGAIEPIDHQPLAVGEEGQNVGVRLRGVKADQVQRGQVLAAPKSIRTRQRFRAEVYALRKDEGGRHTPFFDGYKPQFYVRTTDVTGGH